MRAALHTARVGDIPVLWAEPLHTDRRRLALWLHGFSGTKESVEAQLLDLASVGFVAMSFDAVQHGDRSIESRDALKVRVRANLRLRFWPLLARTAEEMPLIIDWAHGRLGIEPRVAVGGISMGGDIAVVSAAIDHRIDRVAATLATPDWLRPGSSEQQGAADEETWALYQRRNPFTNLGAYRHCPAMTFECGGSDRQVPLDGAMRFVDALRGTYATCPDRLDITIHQGVAHTFTSGMWQRVVAWFQADIASDEAKRP